MFHPGTLRTNFNPGYGFLPRANTEGDTLTAVFLLTQSRLDVACSSAGFALSGHRSGSRLAVFMYSSLKVFGSNFDISKGGDRGVVHSNSIGPDILIDLK